MDSDDQDFLVIRTVEDADTSALGKAARGAPKKIVIEFFCTGLLEAEDLTAFWIDARHHVPYCSVLPGAIHTLEDQQQRIAVRRVVKLLQRTQLFHVLVKKLLIFFLRLRIRIDERGPFAEVDLFVWRNTVVFRIDGQRQSPVLRGSLRNLFPDLLMAPHLLLRLNPILILLTLTVDSLLVDFIGPRCDLGG